MKKLLFVLTLAVAMSGTSFAAGGKKAAKKVCTKTETGCCKPETGICTKTEAGCCKKGDKVSACCASAGNQKIAKK